MPSFPAMYVPRAGSADALDPAAPAIQVAQVPTLTLAKIGDAGTVASHAVGEFVLASQLGTGANQVPQLNGSGKLADAVIPSIALTEFKGHVASQAAMVALTAEPGDWCIRDDTGDEYVLSAAPASTAGNWIEIVKPYSAVTSVAGRTGAITLSTADVSGLGTAAVANTGTNNGNVAVFGAGSLLLGINTIQATNLAGTIALARIPSLPASQITSGVFGTSLLGTGGGAASNFLNGTGAFTAPAPYDQSLNSTDDVTFNTVHIAGAGSIQASGSEFYFPSAAETAGRFTSGVSGLGDESGTVTINAAQADQVEMNLAADVTIANPTSPKNGQGLLIIFTQAGGGGWLITLDTDFSDPFGTATAINGRTADGAVNLMSAIYNSALGKWLVMPDLGGAY